MGTRKHIQAGQLRHLVQIERKVEIQDSIGDILHAWEPITDAPVFAAIEDLSAREFISAQAIQSEITTRITIRYIPGVTAGMRVAHGTTYYNIHGALKDLDSRIEYLTLPCSEGLTDGQ